MQLKFKEESVATLKAANEQHRDRASALDEELQAAQTQIELLHEEMQKKEDEIEQVYLQKEGRAPSTYMVEIAQLKEDNKRLMDMLRNTKEYKDFATYVDDSGGVVRHIEGPQRKTDVPSNAQQQAPRPFQGSFRQGSRGNSRTRISTSSLPRPGTAEKSTKSKAGVDEFPSTLEHGDEEGAQNNENWIPDQAYNYAHDFRNKHGDELSLELVNDMLRDLNRIYRDREKKQISRVKQ